MNNLQHALHTLYGVAGKPLPVHRMHVRVESFPSLHNEPSLSLDDIKEIHDAYGPTMVRALGKVILRKMTGATEILLPLPEFATVELELRKHDPLPALSATNHATRLLEAIKNNSHDIGFDGPIQHMHAPSITALRKAIAVINQQQYEGEQKIKLRILRNDRPSVWMPHAIYNQTSSMERKDVAEATMLSQPSPFADSKPSLGRHTERLQPVPGACEIITFPGRG